MCIVVLSLLDEGLRQLYQVPCECAQSSVQKTARCHWLVLFYHDSLGRSGQLLD